MENLFEILFFIFIGIVFVIACIGMLFIVFSKEIKQQEDEQTFGNFRHFDED